MGKTPPKKEEAEGSPKNKAPRVDDAARTAASAPSPTGKTPPKGDEAEESPRKKTLPLFDLNLPTAPRTSEPNPTGKTPPKGDEAEGSPPKRSRSPRNTSPRQQDKRPAAAVPLATVPESSELIVQGAGRASDKKRCKCNHVITDSAIEESSPFLKFKDALTCFGCWDEDQKGIVKTRPEKSDLLICVTCGYHLCCGVGAIAYPFGHSRAHAQEKEHWFAVLYCDPQRGFCFKCDAEVPMAAKFVSQKLLAPPPSVGPLITALAPSPTGKTPLKGDAKGSPPKRSRSPRRQDKRPAAAVPLATVPESSELIVKGVGRPSDEKWCKCNHVITDSAIDELRAIEEVSRVLTSKDALVCYGCSDEDEEGIVRFRPEKSDLVICVTCNDHLCCGFGSIAYPYGHSRQHARKKQHWFAVLYCDPQRGFCFKCNAEVSMPVKSVSRKLLSPPPLVGQTEAEKAEMTGKVQAGSHPSGSRSSDAQGYAIRGIENLGNTCYMSAVLQCLFVLGKLRERMLADHPKGLLPEVLKELFVEASAAGDVLNPTKVLTPVSWCKKPFFQVGYIEDSHEFLTVLLDLWKESEKIYDRQSNAPTVIDSIFRFEMLQTLACKKCDPALSSHSFLDLKLDFPSKWHQRNLEKMQTVSESGYSRVIGSDVIVEKTHRPLEVDSTQAQRISQSKDVVQSPLQIKEGKSVDSLTEDSISIERLLLLFSKAEVKWSCPNCAKDHKEPSASQSKNSEQIVGSSNEDDVGDTVQTFHFLTLPPVLTLHLNRTSHIEGTSMVENTVGGNTVGIKINGHVRFEEYLDVGRFMVLSSGNNCSTVYRLAGVVEHIGKGSLKEKDGHYVAYVRARRLGNQQESSSCSSSWFRADDRQIRRVTLSEVLKTEAYILFYERMEDQTLLQK